MRMKLLMRQYNLPNEVLNFWNVFPYMYMYVAYGIISSMMTNKIFKFFKAKSF